MLGKLQANKRGCNRCLPPLGILPRSQPPMLSLSPLEIARQQIEFARQYTLELLADLDETAWYTIPPGGVSHVAWQAGHLAMAQYGLCLFRIRGRAEHDAELMSSAFRKCFMKGTTPHPDPAANPRPEEIRAVLARIHQQALTEMATYDDRLLAEPVDKPYAGFPNKLGSLLFCPHHEMLHAGQIGMIRRMLGKTPLR